MAYGPGVGVGTTVGIGTAVAVGTGLGVGVGTLVGIGTAFAVGTGLGVGVGVGIGVGAGIAVGALPTLPEKTGTLSSSLMVRANGLKSITSAEAMRVLRSTLVSSTCQSVPS